VIINEVDVIEDFKTQKNTLCYIYLIEWLK